MTDYEDQLIQKVIADLSQLGEAKPWKSVTTLANKFNIQESYMRQLLLEYSNSIPTDELHIRYSHYPSKRTLDMIWAHTNNIQQLHQLYDYTRIDEPDLRFSNELCDFPRLFLSHSHSDQERALYMREFLLSQNINTWMSEIDIVTGADIFATINQGRDDCFGMIADVTEQSIQSVWVQKEFISSLNQQHKICLVFDGNNGRLLEALNASEPDTVLPSLNITTMFPEYLDYLKEFVLNSDLIFAYPYVKAEIFGKPLLPLQDLKHKFIDVEPESN